MLKTHKTTHVVYVFIDASNLWDVQKSKGQLIDFAKLKTYLEDAYQATELKIFYYAAYPADGTRNYSLDGKHRFFTYLKKGLAFTVRKKPLKRINHKDEIGESVIEKGNMDVELTIDAVHNIRKYDIGILFTGDSDFLELTTYLKRNKKNVFVYSSKNNISHELKTSCNGYVDLLQINTDIWGNPLQHQKK